MKRVNVPLLLLLVAIVVVAAGGVFLLHRYQVSRNVGGLLRLARERIEQGKMAEASSLYGRYLGLRPKDAEVLAEYSAFLLDRVDSPDATRGDLERAFNVSEQAVRLNPKNDALRRDVAKFDLRIGRFSDARAHVSELTSRLETAADSPELVDLRLLEARAALGDGDFDAAARITADLTGYDLAGRAFRAGARPAASAEAAYALLAQVLQSRLNAPDAAKQVLDRLVEVHGDSATAWLELARWHRQANAIDKARECVRTALDIEPDDAAIVFTAFELALQGGDAAWATSLADRAQEIAPDDERTYRSQATIALQRGDRQAAADALKAGIARMPSRGPLLVMLADVQLQMERLDEAAETVAALRDLVGETSPAVGLLEARLLMGRQKWGQAERRLRQIRPLVLGLPELGKQIDICLAVCAEKLGNHDEQLAVSRRMLVDDPTSITARVGTAAALYAAGRNAEALVAYEALAAALGMERVTSIGQVWYPLLQLRIDAAVQEPVASRDWSKVDDLLTSLVESGGVSDVKMTLLRSEVLAQKGEAKSASDMLERLIATGKADAEVWQALATLELRGSGPAAARAVMSRMPESLESAPGRLLLEARVAVLEADDADEALADIEKRARALADDDAETVLRGLASLVVDFGRLDDGERIWKEIAANHPDDIQARSALLQVSLLRSDVEKMRAAAAAVAEIAGDDSGLARLSEAWVQILDVKLAIQQAGGSSSDLSDQHRAKLEEARSLLSDAEALRPGWAQVQVALAEVEGLLGNTSRAIERLQRAVALAPSNRAAVGQLCALLFATNRLDEARAAMAKLGEDPGKGFERLRAEIELREGRLEQAATLAERSVPAETTDATEWLWLGQMLDRCGRRDRAGEALRRATETGPERSDVWLALLSYQFSTGMPRAAQQTLDRAAAAVPANERPLLLAQGYDLLGQFDEAEESFRKAVAEAPPGDLKIMAAHAAFLIRRGRLEPARTELRRLIEVGRTAPGDGATLAWARRTLAELIGTKGSYKNLEEALALLRENASAAEGTAPDDLALELRLLIDRPEPDSWRRGIAMLDTLAETRPLTAGQRLVRAQLLEKCGRWNDARDELVAVVSARSTPAPFIAMLVEKLLDHDEVATARSWFGRLQSVAPQAESTRALHARLVAAENDWSQAIEIVRGLVPTGDISPDRAKTLGPLARLLENFGFPEEAETTWRRLASRSPDGIVGLADFLGRHQRAEEALAVLESARDSLPTEQLVSTALNAVRASGAKEAACRQVEEWLDKAAEIDPDSTTIAILRAELLGVMERHDDAETAYRQLIARRDLSPTEAAIAANNLAFHLARPESAAEAERLIATAMETLGPHPDLLDTRGLIRLAAGDGAGAVADLEEAVLAPSAAKFLHLAYASLRNGDLVQAREALEKSRQKGLGIEVLSPAERTMLEQLEARLRTSADQALDSGGTRSAG